MTSKHSLSTLVSLLVFTLVPTLYGQTIGTYQQNGVGGDTSDTLGYQVSASYFNTFENSQNDLSLVMIGWETSSSSPIAINGVTYGGVSMAHLHTESFIGPNVTQMMAVFYLQNPSDGSSLVEADFSAVPGNAGQLIFTNVLNNVASPPEVYDTASLNGLSLVLSAPAESTSSLYYDLVLHGTSWANYSWGGYPPVVGSGSQDMSYVPHYDGRSSLAMLVGTETTSDAFTHQYDYAVGNNYITGIGLKFAAVPEPSSMFLIGLTGVLGIMRRQRTHPASFITRPSKRV